jgi:hypothetical protein
MRGHYNRKARGKYATKESDDFVRVPRIIYKRIAGRVVRMEPPKQDKYEANVEFETEYPDDVYMASLTGFAVKKLKIQKRGA